jgi:hypothetical protein
MIRVSCNAVLIAAACLVAAARVHDPRVASPVAATQEINRCLSVLRAAAGSRTLQDSTAKRTRRPSIIVL